MCAVVGAAEERALAAADESVAIYEAAARRSRRYFRASYGSHLRQAYAARTHVLTALGRTREAAKMRRKLSRR